MDERFKMHRLYSTRFAAIVVAAAVGFWINYQFFTKHILRWDLFAILMLMVIAKLLAMAYYRIKN
jgi:hypothetical protein